MSGANKNQPSIDEVLEALSRRLIEYHHEADGWQRRLRSEIYKLKIRIQDLEKKLKVTK